MSSPTPEAFKVFQASAGSGKTYTIIKEYLKLCLKNEAATAEYSHILAITFTNMAANEMKEKIVRQLIKIINSDPNKAPVNMEKDLIDALGISRNQLKENAYRLFLNILYNYSDFFICTIDAFVQRLSRSFAKELQLPTQYSVSIDEEEVADDVTERFGELIGAGNPYLNRIVEDYVENQLENEKRAKVSSEIHDFVMKLFKEEAFDKSGGNPFEFEERYKETRDFVNAKVATFEKRCAQLVEDFDAFVAQYGLGPDDFNGKSKSGFLSIHGKLQKHEYPLPSATFSKILRGDANWYSKELSAGRLQQFDALFEAQPMAWFKWYAQHVGAYHFYKSQRDNLSLYVLRSWLKAEMEDYIREEQVVPISEFNKRINTILGDFSVPFIYERMGTRLKHVFIDEFQDTSVLQWHNLIPLLHNGIASGQMSMVVGDGKQSIYRWRSGEVEQIMKLPLIHLKPDDNEAFDEFERAFVNNFRFTELKTNFRSFENIVKFNNEFFLASLEGLSEKYRRIYVENNERFHKQVSVEQHPHKQQPGYVALELIDSDDADQLMLERTKALVDELTCKGFLLSDITILVRANRHGKLVADYLSRSGIPVVSADSILLKSSNKVRLIIATLDYLIHPDNPLAAATMNYYWNLLRQECFDGVADGFFGQGPDTEPFKALMMRSYSLYDLCSALMRHYGMDSAGDTYLGFLLDVVHQWQDADESGINHFLEYWEKKKNSLTVVSGKADAVTVTTIHKSKGLQYNVVICPFVKDDLDDRKTPVRWVAPSQLGFESIPNVEKVQFSITSKSREWSGEAETLAAEEDALTRLDNMNLIYVAFTRAVQRLHILSYKAKPIKTKSDKPAHGSPINTFLETHPATYGDPDTCKVELEDDEDKETVEEFYHESHAGDWIGKISIDPNPSMFWAHPDDPMKPQEWGEFVHQVLSEIHDAADIERALRPHRDSGVIDQAKADLLTNLFFQMSTHPVIGEAFSPAARVKNECDILLENGDIKRPDRYAELPDKIYLLDYKTGQKTDDNRRQLRRYMDLVGKMVAKPIEGYLVYLRDALEVERV